MELPRYRCHKEVRALKIKDVSPFPDHLLGPGATDGSALVVPSEPGYKPIHVSAEYMRKHRAQPGGYFVVYDDGYQSYSPARAFEEGYTKI